MHWYIYRVDQLQCFLPDLIHYVIPMRDAPTLAKEPELKRVDEKWYADREVVDSNA
jgi:hypothetical protein